MYFHNDTVLYGSSHTQPLSQKIPFWPKTKKVGRSFCPIGLHLHIKYAMKEESSSSDNNNSQEEPTPKKPKMTTDSYPQAPDEEWPEAWLMSERVEDQCKPNKQEPNVPISAADLRKIGINYWKLDANAYKYPIKAVPWNPDDAVDPQLKALRDDRGAYFYFNIIKRCIVLHLPVDGRTLTFCLASSLFRFRC